MPGKPEFTKTWEKTKEEFLKRHDYKSQVETYVDHIIEYMSNNQPMLLDKTRGYFNVETRLENVAYEDLTCVCAVNEQTGDFAPAALYFPGAKRTESMSDISRALTEVRAELGW